MSPTLVTFFLETSPFTRTVHLLGSWDNFTEAYTMERDSRRDRGQWKGCHSFKNGGLKMGQTYYYYYELDGSTEVHDPSLPSTTACPSLPGQPVNTIHVPFEMSTRKRSASLSSVRDCDFMTVKPEHKFLPTRAAPLVPEPPLCRQATSHVRSLVHKRSTRSLSPNPSWSWSPRRLFSRSKSSHNQKGVARNDEPDGQHVEVLMEEQDERPIFRSPSAQSCRSRDISPDSLLRFLSDDAPLPPPEFAIEEDLDGPALFTTEDIAEENDDDDNFATSAQSETAPVTVLSPPPSQRSFSSSSSLARLGKQSRPQTPAHPVRSASTLPTLDASRPQSRLSINSLTAPHSPESTLSQAPSFYFSDDDDDDDDDEEAEEVEGDGFGLRPLQAINTSFGASFGSLLANFSCYTLPEAAMSENKMTPTTVTPGHVAHREAVAPAISIARVEDSRDLADELC